jgi:hypothetical protein
MSVSRPSGGIRSAALEHAWVVESLTFLCRSDVEIRFLDRGF